MVDTRRTPSGARSRRGRPFISSLATLILAGACSSSANDLFDSTNDAGSQCETNFELCADCFSAVECGPAAECIRNHCVPFTSCASRTECGSEQVCHVELGRCVECLADADCDAGETCVSQRCRLRCQSDKDCRTVNLLCDQAAGYCAACAAAAPCDEGQACVDGDCVARVCEPGVRACGGGGIVTCSADGSGFGEPERCPAGCITGADGPRCENEQDGSMGDGGGGSGGSGGEGGAGGGGSGGDGGSSGTSGSGGSGGGDGGPTVVLLIDYSTSAEALLPDGITTRWSMMQSDTIGAIRAAQQRSLQVALGVYGYTGFVPPFDNQCLAFDGFLPGENNFARAADLVAALTMPAAKSETPTGTAIERMAQLLASRPGKRSIILITDGIPDTCAQPDQPCWDQTVHALQTTYSVGITTAVVGIGPDVPSEMLQDLANAGAGLPVQAPPPTRTLCGPNTPTYAASGGSARFDHVLETGLQEALLGVMTSAAGP
jgi:hypothetical protein